jgi:hypothetical protein
MITISITTPEAKACYLMLSLEVKSLADRWFQALDQAMKTDWAQLEPAFMQKWTML